ncbi:hypothetical protein G3N56_03685 [Desulfovibrio sulfodismutans]|uniref:Uncharacterized protein n=1 Tax=Desulfolutivibrio sulfodismutans TaxID=63561 RepID=A0A7K3NI31_9BACT|nr:hypothetical protein [Desulfolutivibrio sulfodismutans]NDY55842.1 hypothetical protein [Desulfolutivibrio sulfodismutans]QLA14244.1 hypothetical protein GD606_19225 [Desulfolutivibrio sulfodismutans DSM 3696]
MNRDLACKIFEKSFLFCRERYPEEIDWAKNTNAKIFRNMKSKQFLSEYCWVVYASGFKESILSKYFPSIKLAFKNFDLESLSRMRGISRVLNVFNNEKKASWFLSGSKLIANEGFTSFKKRLKKNGIDVLKELDGISDVTKFHLAKNIGLVDTEKPDRWIVRISEMCNSTTEELFEMLCKSYNLSRHVVDVVLWRYASQNSIEHF